MTIAAYCKANGYSADVETEKRVGGIAPPKGGNRKTVSVMGFIQEVIGHVHVFLQSCPDSWKTIFPWCKGRNILRPPVASGVPPKKSDEKTIAGVDSPIKTIPVGTCEGITFRVDKKLQKRYVNILSEDLISALCVDIKKALQNRGHDISTVKYDVVFTNTGGFGTVVHTAPTIIFLNIIAIQKFNRERKFLAGVLVHEFRHAKQFERFNKINWGSKEIKKSAYEQIAGLLEAGAVLEELQAYPDFFIDIRIKMALDGNKKASAYCLEKFGFTFIDYLCATLVLKKLTDLYNKKRGNKAPVSNIDVHIIDQFTTSVKNGNYDLIKESILSFLYSHTTLKKGNFNTDTIKKTQREVSTELNEIFSSGNKPEIIKSKLCKSKIFPNFAACDR
jgi:hypothetical protein